MAWTHQTPAGLVVLGAEANALCQAIVVTPPLTSIALQMYSLMGGQEAALLLLAAVRPVHHFKVVPFSDMPSFVALTQLTRWPQNYAQARPCAHGRSLISFRFD